MPVTAPQFHRQDVPKIAIRLMAQRIVRQRQLHRTLSPEHQLIWERCKTDLEAFALEFFPHLCQDPFSLMHQEMFAHDREHAGERNLREATAVPRGSAKTTI